MGDCGKRAFEAGLRWCGIFDEVPSLETSDKLKEHAERYGLIVITSGTLSKIGNAPVLVVYEDGREATDDQYHAVFCSDAAPFSRWKNYMFIVGWEKINRC